MCVRKSRARGFLWCPCVGLSAVCFSFMMCVCERALTYVCVRVFVCIRVSKCPCVHVCLPACERASVRASERACKRACVLDNMFFPSACNLFSFFLSKEKISWEGIKPTLFFILPNQIYDGKPFCHSSEHFFLYFATSAFLRLWFLFKSSVCWWFCNARVDVCDVCVFHTYITLIALPHFAELFLSNTAKKKINPEFISNNLDCS